MNNHKQKLEKEQELLAKHLKQLADTGNYNFYELKIFNDLEDNKTPK